MIVKVTLPISPGAAQAHITSKDGNVDMFVSVEQVSRRFSAYDEHVAYFTASFFEGHGTVVEDGKVIDVGRKTCVLQLGDRVQVKEAW